jgi:hypothetical protein
LTAGRDGIGQIHTCPLCADSDQLLAQARARITRELTPAERQRFLHE